MRNVRVRIKVIDLNERVTVSAWRRGIKRRRGYDDAIAVQEIQLFSSGKRIAKSQSRGDAKIRSSILHRPSPTLETFNIPDISMDKG
jgi:hypothetical protein